MWLINLFLIFLNDSRFPLCINLCKKKSKIWKFKKGRKEEWWTSIFLSGMDDNYFLWLLNLEKLLLHGQKCNEKKSLVQCSANSYYSKLAAEIWKWLLIKQRKIVRKKTEQKSRKRKKCTWNHIIVDIVRIPAIFFDNCKNF